MKRFVVFFVLLTLAGWSEGLTDLEYAADTVGGKWISSSGASIYVGAASHEGKIDITINGGRPIRGYIGQEPDGSIYFTYTSPDGATMNAEYNSDGQVIYVKSLDSAFTSMWRRP